MPINYNNYNNKLFILFIILCLFCLSKICNAGSEGGHTTVINNIRGKATKSVPEMFVSKSITGTSTRIYNQVGSSTINDGWVDVREYKNKALSLSVPSYSSGSISARLECLTGSSTLNSEISTTTFTGVTTVGTLVNITQNVEKLRVGWIISSPTGSGSVSSALYCEE